MADPNTTSNASVTALSSPILTGCHILIPELDTSYGYQPSLAAGVTFSVLFFLFLCAHLFFAIQIRKWTSILLSVSALVELLGWAARTWASKCPYAKTPFMMQIITLVIGPVFVTTAIYVVLDELIRARSTEYSLLRPHLYIIIFCTCDVFALIIQATGAALASRAFDDGTDTTPGSHTVAGGVIFQLATMAVFAMLLIVFLVRSRSLSITSCEHFVVLAMWTSFIAVYTRSAFRAIQLLQGFHGYLSTHEGLFIGLDGVVMAIAIGVFVVIQPDVYFRNIDKL